MPTDPIPQDIRDLADARVRARRARDWATADDLRARIEDAGWRVIDAGTLYSLERAAPPDALEDGVPRYGSSRSVPSRLDEPATGVASVVLVATHDPAELRGALDGLAVHAPAETQLIVVAEATPEALPAGELVRTATRLSQGAALNAGIRRAAAPIVILLDPGLVVHGDVVSPLVAALADERVAVAGAFGLASSDLHRFTVAPAHSRDVVAIGGGLLAFRRVDYVARGPLDERFVTRAALEAWWSLVLRDPFAAPDADEAAKDAAAGSAAAGLPGMPTMPPPRRAVVVTDLPVTRRVAPAVADDPAAGRDRPERRDAYRILKRFAGRRDLLVPAGPGGPGPGG